MKVPEEWKSKKKFNRVHCPQCSAMFRIPNKYLDVSVVVCNQCKGRFEREKAAD